LPYLLLHIYNTVNIVTERITDIASAACGVPGINIVSLACYDIVTFDVVRRFTGRTWKTRTSVYGKQDRFVLINAGDLFSDEEAFTGPSRWIDQGGGPIKRDAIVGRFWHPYPRVRYLKRRIIVNIVRWMCCIVLCWDDRLEVMVPLPTNQAVMDQFAELRSKIRKVVPSNWDIEVVVVLKSGP
jgi:hypothetical protein